MITTKQLFFYCHVFFLKKEWLSIPLLSIQLPNRRAVIQPEYESLI
jgi:hypothetical protein